MRTHAVRFAGAAIAALTATAITLTVCTGVLRLAATPAAMLSWFAGAVVSYVLSRLAWERRGRPDLLRETIPFLTVSALVLVLLTLATRLGYRSAAWLHLTGVPHVLWVDLIWLLANACTFLLRFLLFHFLLFTARPATATARRCRPPFGQRADLRRAAPLAPPGAQHDAREPAPVDQHVEVIQTSKRQIKAKCGIGKRGPRARQAGIRDNLPP